MHHSKGLLLYQTHNINDPWYKDQWLQDMCPITTPRGHLHFNPSSHLEEVCDFGFFRLVSQLFEVQKCKLHVQCLLSSVSGLYTTGVIITISYHLQYVTIMCMAYHPHDIAQVSFCWIKILFLNSSYSHCQASIWFGYSIHTNHPPEAAHSSQRITRKWEILSCTVSINSVS